MREIHARKSSIDSSCFPANCSSRDQAFNTASWLTSSASAAFLVSPRARRYSVGMYGETISPNASGFPFRARASKLERHCGPALKQRVTVAALISGVQSGSRSARAPVSSIYQKTQDIRVRPRQGALCFRPGCTAFRLVLVERLAHQPSQCCWAVGFLQLAGIRALRRKFTSICRIAAGEQNWQVRKHFQEARSRPRTAKLGHNDVQNGQRRRFVRAEFQCFLAVTGGEYPVAHAEKRLPRHFSNRFMVFGEQNCFRAV